MEKRTMNLTAAQEKVFRAFAKAFGLVHIYEIGENIFPEAVRREGMKFSGTINSETYVNTEGTGLIGKELCSEYTEARGRRYWYVFNLSPMWGEAYTVFETVKPRSQKVLKSTLDAYEMLLNAIEVDADRLNEFWKIDVGDAETPWDAMRTRLWKWLHREGVC